MWKGQFKIPCRQEKETVFNPFPIWKLPHLALRQCLLLMDMVHVVRLSILSEPVKNSAKTLSTAPGRPLWCSISMIGPFYRIEVDLGHPTTHIPETILCLKGKKFDIRSSGRSSIVFSWKQDGVQDIGNFLIDLFRFFRIQVAFPSSSSTNEFKLLVEWVRNYKDLIKIIKYGTMGKQGSLWHGNKHAFFLEHFESKNDIHFEIGDDKFCLKFQGGRRILHVTRGNSDQKHLAEIWKTWKFRSFKVNIPVRFATVKECITSYLDSENEPAEVEFEVEVEEDSRNLERLPKNFPAKVHPPWRHPVYGMIETLYKVQRPGQLKKLFVFEFEENGKRHLAMFN